jgi:VTC domain
MTAEHQPDAWLTGGFSPISLGQLNNKAAMLERLDNKYVARQGVLSQALADLAKHFDVLEIDGKRSFIYETCYFDDAHLHGYHDHHQGRRKRCKVRVRRYTDAALCFVEVKLKDKRGITVKKRLKVSPESYGVLGSEALAHIETSYSGLYGEAFVHHLQPVIEMRYRRITLVAKEGGERLTIDGGIAFENGGVCRHTDADVFIVEAKSANGNGLADRILRRLHQHPTPSCSKYCVGMAALNLVGRHNKFLPALRKLNALPQPAAAHIGAPDEQQ